MTEEAQFLAQVEKYHTLTASQAKELLERKEGEVLFIGRETCPYCRRFSTKLAELVDEKGIKVHFLHSQNPADLQEVNQLRQTYHVPTVPGLLVARAAGVEVKCDSSMTKAEILDFIQ